MFDAEGQYENELCPKCGSRKTVTYHFAEGFSELECESCGYMSDDIEISNLHRYRGDLLETKNGAAPPIPLKKLEA